MKSVLWRVTKRLSYIQDARCLNVSLLASDAVIGSVAIEVSNDLPRCDLVTLRTYRRFD